MAVVTVPDNRWGRVDIKSVSLLPNVLAKQAARDQGAREAWLVDAKGMVTEGASSNAWIVTADRKLVTRPTDHAILRGITRTVVLDVLRAQGLMLDERPFTVAEAHAAQEAFVTSASQTVLPVVKIDGKPVGSGKPGKITHRMQDLFFGLFDGRTEDRWGWLEPLAGDNRETVTPIKPAVAARA